MFDVAGESCNITDNRNFWSSPVANNQGKLSCLRLSDSWELISLYAFKLEVYGKGVSIAKMMVVFFPLNHCSALICKSWKQCTFHL